MGRLATEGSSARTLVIEGVEYLAFAGCGYLALGHDPRVLEAMKRGLDEHGLASGASIETTGAARVHDELERALAAFLGVEAALLLPSGYLANLAVAQGLSAQRSGTRRDRWVLLDEYTHASVLDGVAAASCSAMRYTHLDAASAAANAGELGNSVIAIASDACFPGERRVAPVVELLQALGARSAPLWLDDCHGFGVLGASGRGTLEHLVLSDARIVVSGTLSKSFGCVGGFVAAREDIVEAVREHSRAYIGASPIPPAAACAALCALELFAAEPERLVRLRANEKRVRECLQGLGLALGPAPLPVFALALDRPQELGEFQESMRARGLFVPHVRYLQGPSEGYLRFTVNAAHTGEDIERLCSALVDLLPPLEPRGLKA